MISSLPGTTDLPPAPVEGVQTPGVSLLPRNDGASRAPVSSPQSTPEIHALAGSTSEVAPSVTASPEYEQSAQASSASTTSEFSARAPPADPPYVPSASPPSVLPNTSSPASEASAPSTGATSVFVQADDSVTATDPLVALWQQAIARYKDDTGVDLSSQSGTRFESQGSIVHYLDEQEKKFTKFRDRGCAARVCSALASIAPVLQPLCVLAGEGAGMVFAPSKVIFSAVGELVKAAVEADRELDSIVDAFDTIDHHLRILKSDAAHEILRDEALKEASVKLLAQILTILGVIQKVQREGRLVLWLKKLDNSKQVSSALDELGRLAANQHHTISAATLFTAKETMSILIECEASAKDNQAVARKYLAHITKIAQQIHGMFTTQEQTSVNRGILENIQRVLLQQAHDIGVVRDTADIDKIFRWLQYPDSSVKMNTLLDDRAKSTGSWFLDGKDYTTFERGEKRSIWLYGKGAGACCPLTAFSDHCSSSWLREKYYTVRTLCSKLRCLCSCSAVRRSFVIFRCTLYPLKTPSFSRTSLTRRTAPSLGTCARFSPHCCVSSL
ncbi:hypothetical protein BD626DRAFT_390463 [Schizophyllum amplum]|uniref:Fungal STAND N-terminal Goodbye domain-containing protein n=1 Tax=Schizophyllum amplum TaxID=97359 RepID=A0A550CVH4_9AGAR|nr:hypothetical protein BD626DRAFT_390463 [Auriculariopsis ampla]